jgi:hypothetical protein
MCTSVTAGNPNSMIDSFLIWHNIDYSCVVDYTEIKTSDDHCSREISLGDQSQITE